MRILKITIDLAIELRNDGYSIPEISNLLNISETAAYRHTFGVKLKQRRGSITTIEMKEARTLRALGLGYRAISKIFNTTYHVIRNNTMHVKITNGQPQAITNLYSYNVSLFKHPISTTYYLLGAFMSDGCIDRNLRRVSISSKDEVWLKDISKILTIPAKIPRKIKNSNCWSLAINNKEIVNWLITMNCVPNKSLKLEMPEIPLEYVGDFIRGVFDGDGSIGIAQVKKSNTQTLRLYIVSGSKMFAEQISKILNNFEIKNQIATIENKNISIMGRPPKNYQDTYRVYCNGKSAVKFCNLIYDNHNSIICLNRKYDIFKKYLEIRKWELDNCKIRKQFDNYNSIVEMLKTLSYSEVANIFNVTPKTVADRLKRAGLFKAERKY